MWFLGSELEPFGRFASVTILRFFSMPPAMERHCAARIVCGRLLDAMADDAIDNELSCIACELPDGMCKRVMDKKDYSGGVVA